MTAWIDVDSVMEYLGSDAPVADDADGQERLANSIMSASELLYALSGRKFAGVQTATVKPTSRMEQQTRPMLYGAFAFIGLGRYPIVSIDEVITNDGVLDPANYHVDDAKWLVLDTHCCATWPSCSCLDELSVTLKFGEDPPQMGQDAALILSAEMYRAMTPSMSCKLPARMTSITRQGISFALIDPMDFMDKGLTGIYQVDMFIKAYNPGGQVRRPMVWSPDLANTGKRVT